MSQSSIAASGFVWCQPFGKWVFIMNLAANSHIKTYVKVMFRDCLELTKAWKFGENGFTCPSSQRLFLGYRKCFNCWVALDISGHASLGTLRELSSQLEPSSCCHRRSGKRLWVCINLSCKCKSDVGQNARCNANVLLLH